MFFFYYLEKNYEKQDLVIYFGTKFCFVTLDKKKVILNRKARTKQSL